jgi:hypothetical protein
MECESMMMMMMMNNKIYEHNLVSRMYAIMNVSHLKSTDYFGCDEIKGKGKATPLQA